MTRKMFAMLTNDGTAASETALCEHHLTGYDFFVAEMNADKDVDKKNGFVDCTENDQLECVRCGWRNQ